MQDTLQEQMQKKNKHTNPHTKPHKGKTADHPQLNPHNTPPTIKTKTKIFNQQKQKLFLKMLALQTGSCHGLSLWTPDYRQSNG